MELKENKTRHISSIYSTHYAQQLRVQVHPLKMARPQKDGIKDMLTEKLTQLISETDRFRYEVNMTSEHIDYLSDQLRLTDNAYRNIRGELQNA